MDGEITIGTTLSTDKFDRQILDLEKKIQKEEEKKIVLDAKIQVQEEEFERARQKTDELADAYQRLEQLQKTISSGKATPQQFTMAQELQRTYGSLDQLELSFLKALNKQDAINEKAFQMRTRYQEINDKVAEYKQKIESINLQKQVSEANRLKQSFNNVGSSIQNAVTKIGKLALGIFGIRSAFMLLRRASSDLANYDKQYATNLEYIRYALTQAIAPVLKWIVTMAAQLIKYIGMIIQSLFGVNIFANASAESFNKMKRGATGVSKAVKEIKKQLTGFDEINMLTDQSDTGTSAGAGGVSTPLVKPEFDFSNITGEIPEWLKWIITGVIGLKIADFLNGLGVLGQGLTGFDKLLLGLGIGITIKGIFDLIKSIKKYLEEPTWENFIGILESADEVLIGIGIILGVLTGNWIPLIMGLVGKVAIEVAKHWDEIKETLGKVGKWIFDNVITPVGKFFSGLWTNIKKTFEPVVKFFKDNFGDAWEAIKGAFKNVGKFFSDIWSTIKGIFKDIGQKVGDAFGDSFKAAVNAAFDIIEEIINFPINAINTLLGIINKVPGINIPFIPTLNLPRLATGGIVNMPNRGTMVGGAIAGESGREGVIPLTDSQAMAELGREIGKNVLVNLTNITQMNGRVIGRELKQVQSEQDFAFNL